MKKTSFLLYGIFCYIAFLSTILYAVGFVGNFIVPKTIDGIPETPLLPAILIDVLLLLLFALQHSVMARSSFKLWWIRIIPAQLERSSFVLLSSLCLILLMWQWQPVGGVIWSVENKIARVILHIAYLAGWSIVFISTFLINHFDLFGLRQVWLYFIRKPYTPLPFRTPSLYQLVRHPLYMGFLIAFWSAPVMTIAHLLFVILTTIYIVVAIRFEEKDLVTQFREKYLHYKNWTPMLVPFFRRKRHNASK